MDSKDLVKAGKLLEARKQLIEEVKSSPADLGKRTLLFQVLCFLGEWDKADRQLEAISAQNIKTETGVQVYKNLVNGEKERMEVAKLQRRPSCLPHIPAYLDMHFAAWEKVVEDKAEEAEDLFRKIDAQRHVISGSIDGRSITDLRDTDTFLSYFLEAIVHEHYVWIPFESIRELSIPAPTGLFDLLWSSARVTTWEGLTMSCYLPVLYPESCKQDDDRIKLGRMTDWLPLGGPFSKAVGQHVFRIGDEEMAILEIREARFKLSDSVSDDEKSN